MFSSQQLTELLNEPYGVIANDIGKLQRLVQYYQHIYGVEACVGCGGKNKYELYYKTLKIEGISIMENKENTSFVFNKGVTIVPMTFGSNRMLTPITLTDDLALEFLSGNENRITLFEKYPEDWKEQVAAFKSNKTADADTKKVETKTTSTATPVEEQKQDEIADADTKSTTTGKGAKKK